MENKAEVTLPILTIQRNIFSERPKTLNARTFSQPTIWEYGLLLLNISFLVVFIRQYNLFSYGFIDYFNYLDAVQGDFSEYYYAYWGLPLFSFFSWLPRTFGLFLWGLVNILGVFWGARVFGNHTAIVLSTYQLFYSIFFGQIIGIIIGGIGLFWWGLRNGNWIVAGLGILLAIVKYHAAIPVLVGLVLLGDHDWQIVVKSLLVPILFSVSSLALYPHWPTKLVQTILHSPPDASGNICLWQWFGPYSLLLWLPVFLVPLSKMRRLFAFVASISMTIPYYQQTDLLTLFVFPIQWLTWLGNLGFAFVFKGEIVFKWMIVVPALVYIISIGCPSINQDAMARGNCDEL